MTTIPFIFILLIICLLACFSLLFIIVKKINKSQLRTCFICLLSSILICLIGLVLQCTLGNYLSIPLIYYDYIVYIGSCFLPVFFFFTARVFSNTKIKISAAYLALFIVPIISLLIVWTNDFHHLFYIKYSTNLSETVYGNYMTIHSAYSYILLAVSIIFLLKYSIKNSGFFSKQALLLIIGSLLPLIVNLLGYLEVIPMTIYITPICFSVTIFFYAIAILKFSFLSTSPIALQRIADRISDGYLVLDENNIITDFNSTVLKMFHLNSSYLRGKNLFDLIKEKNVFSINEVLLKDSIIKVKNSDETFHFESKLNNEKQYFNIEINSIRNNNNFLGTLILFKDTTQHMLDMQTIQDNQNMLMEKERLASLGQLIGGIAHNLKTPIMSIAGAAEGLNDLAKEYDTSIEDPEVNFEDHHAIAKDMFEWIDKVKTHTAYMSDVITAVKGQAVALSGEQVSTFTMEELIKHVNILMRHELKNALIDLNVSMQVDPELEYKGNINSLVQVINNMISNAIQAYNGKTGQVIDLIVEKQNNKLVISIKDYGPGMSKDVKNKLFKEMITTKGKNGTGLGLFMSYSNIRAHFNGNITVDSELGKGTTFNIILPLN